MIVITRAWRHPWTCAQPPQCSGSPPWIKKIYVLLLNINIKYFPTNLLQISYPEVNISKFHPNREKLIDRPVKAVGKNPQAPSGQAAELLRNQMFWSARLKIWRVEGSSKTWLQQYNSQEILIQFFYLNSLLQACNLPSQLVKVRFQKILNLQPKVLLWILLLVLENKQCFKLVDDINRSLRWTFC